MGTTKIRRIFEDYYCIFKGENLQTNHPPFFTHFANSIRIVCELFNDLKHTSSQIQIDVDKHCFDIDQVIAFHDSVDKI